MSWDIRANPILFPAIIKILCVFLLHFEIKLQKMFECWKIRGLLDDRILPEACCVCATIIKFGTVMELIYILSNVLFPKESTSDVPEIFYQTDKNLPALVNYIYTFLKIAWSKKWIIMQCHPLTLITRRNIHNFIDTATTKKRFLEWLYWFKLNNLGLIFLKID